MADDPRWIEYMPLSDLAGRRAPRNPKRHHRRGIRASIERRGVVEHITLDERTGRLVAGHGRLDEYEDLHAEQAEPPEGVVVGDDGEWLIPVARGWSSVDDDDARAYLVASNQLVIAGGWDTEELASLLEQTQRVDPSLLETTGFSDAEITALLSKRPTLPLPGDVDDDTDDGAPMVRYGVVIEVDTEAEQVALLERFAAEGLTVRALMGA